jgi:hypothetical protein
MLQLKDLLQLIYLWTSFEMEFALILQIIYHVR